MKKRRRRKRRLAKKEKILISVLILVLLLLAAAIAASVFHNKQSRPQEEVRAVWLAYVDFKDLGLHNQNEADFRQTPKPFLIRRRKTRLIRFISTSELFGTRPIHRKPFP